MTVYRRVYLFLQIPQVKPSPLVVEASLRRVFANAHTYHINSISVNSDQETYLSADDLRINLWNLEITDQSFSKSSIRISYAFAKLFSAAEVLATSVRKEFYQLFGAGSWSNSNA